MHHFSRALRSILAAAVVGLVPLSSLAQSGPTESIQEIRGIAVAPLPEADNTAVLLIGSEYGLLRSSPDGLSAIAANLGIAVSALAADPNQPGRLYLSGVDGEGKSVGLMVSEDNGVTWKALTSDIAGEGQIRSLSVRPGAPDTLVAINNSVVVSRDRGATWEVQPTTPEKLFSVAASSIDENRFYAATIGGLLFSDDDGQTWVPAYDGENPATLVATLTGNRVMAYIYGIGLVAATEPDLGWELMTDGFEDRYLLNLTEDPQNPDTIYVTADTGAILLSQDAGATWISYEGSDKYTPERLARGKALFQENCQACHGVKGIGEAPDDPEAKDELGFKAPALNDDMHAWHHGDAGIIATVSKGSPRNKRMVAFSEQLSDEDIENVVVYLKSLWSLRSLACQGGRHMACLGN